MSLRDYSNTFMSGQAITASAAGSEINLRSVYDAGNGNQLYIVAACVVAMTGSDSTVTLTLRQDSATGMGSPTTLATIATFAATSAAGTKYVYAIPPGLITEQFLDVYATVANGNLSTGSFDVFLTSEPNVAKLYADNIDYNKEAS